MTCYALHGKRAARPQESLRVEARHVDLKNSRWVFPESESKTKQIRVIYLTNDALAITRRRMLRFPNGPIFRNSRDKPWTVSSVNCTFFRIQICMGRELMKSRSIDASESEVRTLASELEKAKRKVCKSDSPTPADYRCVARRQIRERIARSLVPKYCLYHLRHTWINRLLRNGVDALTVAVLAGHSDPSMIAKTYQHLSQCPQFLLEQAKRVAG